MDYKNIGRNTQVGTFVAAPTIVAIDSTVGTNYGVYNIGGYKEVYKLSDLNFVLTGGTAGQILQNSGNTIPVVFTPRPNSLFADKVSVNDDGMSSGRRRLGMLVYVHETDTVYQYTIPNYSQIWSAATSNNAIVADGDGWTVINKVPNNPAGSPNAAGQALIDAWTGSTIEGVSGATASNSRWRIFWGTDWQVTGGTVNYNSSGDLSLNSNSGNTVTISGLTTITGGTYLSGTSTLELYNNLGNTISVTGFTGGGGGTSGSSGSSGTSGSSGSSGTSGSSGSSGTSGSSGSSGTSGTLDLTGNTIDGIITYNGSGGSVESNITFDGNSDTLVISGDTIAYGNEYNQSADITITTNGSHNVLTIPSSSGSSFHYNYFVEEQTTKGFRTGIVMAAINLDKDETVYTDISTNDGTDTTEDIQFSTVVSGNNLVLRATTSNNTTWVVKVSVEVVF